MLSGNVTMLAAGDLDSDGDPDLVVATEGTTADVFLNGATGATWTLGSTLNSGAPGGPQGTVYLHDNEGDGDLDVMVGTFYDSASYANNGAGTSFTKSPSVNGGTSVLTDADGDGDLDIVGFKDGDTWVTAATGSSWGTSNQQFNGTVPGPLGSATDATDANRDGLGDYLVCASNGVHVGLSLGTDLETNPADFTVVTIATPDAPFACRFGDVDQDGDADVVVLAAGSGDDLTWYANNGDGTSWSAATTIAAVVPDPQDVTVDDVDQDGDLDLLVANDDNIVIYDNQGAATGWTAFTVTSTLLNARSPILADIDGDGDQDIVTGSANSTLGLVWYANQTVHSTASFGAQATITTGLDNTQPGALADLDGDGDLDAVGLNDLSGSQGTAFYALNTSGDGATWSAAVTVTSGLNTGREALAADIDGDGDQDIVTVANFSPDATRWVPNDLDGSGAFLAHQVIATTSTARQSVAVDYDRDGDIDLLQGYNSGNVVFLANGGDGASWSSIIAASYASNANDVAVGDVDGDGALDIVLAHNDAGVSGLIWLRSVSANWTAVNITTPGSRVGLSAIELADLDGDGDLDIVSETSNGLELFTNPGAPNNTSGLWAATLITFSSTGSRTNLADVDHDGDIDVVQTQSNAVVVHENELNGTVWTTITKSVSGAESARLGDIDRDGVLDVYYAIDSSSVEGYGWAPILLQQAAATTTDASPLSIEEGAGAVVLSLAADHTLGRTGDLDIELGSVALFLHDGAGVPLSDPDADSIFDSIAIWADDGDGVLTASDVLVTDASSFALAAGELTLTAPVGLAGASAPFGSTTDYFVVANVSTGAVAAGFTSFGLDHLPSEGTLLSHAGMGVPLTLDGSPAGISGVSVPIAPLDSDNDGDPDSTDCDDLDSTIYAGAPEVCDAVDNDCDASTDEDFDADGDGAFTSADAGCVSTYGPAADCDDAAAGVNPSATEVCDLIDNDCDSSADEGFNLDSDAASVCGPDGISGTADDDCDDTNNTVFPGAPEACDFVDSDCDGDLVDTFINSDTDALPDCVDTDDDDDGDPDTSDCSDTDSSIYTGAPELCDNVDSDCDGDLVDGFVNTDGDALPDCVDLDDDGDGMPDDWELAQSPPFDPLDPSDSVDDPDADGRTNADEYAGSTDPYVSDGPSSPTALAPADGVYVNTDTPTLQVSNATSPGGDALTYTFTLYDSAGATGVVFSEGDIPEATGATSLLLPSPLDEDTQYWWSASASDAFVDGPDSEVVSFVVDTAGLAPSTPSPVAPLDGAVLDIGPFSVVWEDAVSPETTPLTYTVEILDAANVLLGGASVADSTGGEESWEVDVALVGNTFYKWRVQATDLAGRSGAFSESQRFGYGAVDGAPSTPTFLSPTDGSTVEEPSPLLRVTESLDPEGGVVDHLLTIDTDDDFADATILELPGDSSGMVSFDTEAEGLALEPGASWFLRIRGRDINGTLSGATTISISREGLGDDDDSTAADDDDTEPANDDIEAPGFVIGCSQQPGHPGWLALLMVGLLLGVLRSRDSGAVRRVGLAFLATLLLVVPTLAHASSASESAMRAHQFHQEYCAEVAAGATTSSLEAMRQVVPVLTRLSQVYDQTGASYLLYWRALLLQCTGQERRALEDHQRFLANEKNQASFPTLWTDAQRRVRQLERATGGAVKEPAKPRFSLGVGGSFELLAAAGDAFPYGGFALDATVMSPVPIGGAFLVRLAGSGPAKAPDGQVADPMRRSLLPVLGAAAVLRFGDAVRPRFMLGVQVGIGNASSHELPGLPGVLAGAGVEISLGDAPVAIRPSVEFGSLGRFFDLRGVVQVVLGR